MDNDKCLTIYEAAALLGVSDATVRRRIRSGALVGRRVSGGGGGRWEWMLPASQPALAQLCEPSGPRPPRGSLECDLAEIVGRLQTRINAQTIELAKVRKIADVRGEKIMELQRQIRDAESSAQVAEYLRAGHVMRRREELILALLAGSVVAALAVILISSAL